MRIPIAAVWLSLAFVYAAHAQDSFTVFGSTVNYTRPNPDLWTVKANGMKADTGKYILMFGRNPIKDAKGNSIRPVIAIICESITDPEVNVIKYSIMRRSQTSFEVDRVFTWENGDITYKFAVGYEGWYKDELVHKVIVVHMRHGKLGAQVICDSTAGVYDKVEKDMRDFIKSVTFK